MRLTTFFSNSKAKQVTMLHESFKTDPKGRLLTYSETLTKAKEVAFDIAGGNLLSCELEID